MFDPNRPPAPPGMMQTMGGPQQQGYPPQGGPWGQQQGLPTQIAPVPAQGGRNPGQSGFGRSHQQQGLPMNDLRQQYQTGGIDGVGAWLQQNRPDLMPAFQNYQADPSWRPTPNPAQQPYAVTQETFPTYGHGAPSMARPQSPMGQHPGEGNPRPPMPPQAPTAPPPPGTDRATSGGGFFGTRRGR